MPVSRRRYALSRRRFGFESLEARWMLNAQDIIDENALQGVARTVWEVKAPITVQPTPNHPPIERHPSPYNVPWNGFTDSTLQTYSDRIQGFTSRVSYDLGEPNLTIEFKVDSPTANFDVEIYRLGDYRIGAAKGAGARLMAKLSNNPMKTQPAPAIQVAETGLVDASNWAVENVKWSPEKINGRYYYRSPNDAPGPDGKIPAYPLLSGVFYAKLNRLGELPGKEKASAVVFVLRDDTGAASRDGQPSDIVMQTADTTWQAYNFWGNKSLYIDKSVPYAFEQAPPQYTRGIKVSYNRPYDWVLPVTGEELDTIMFLERNGYNVSYTTHVDVDRRYAEFGDAPGAGSLRQHKVYIAPGHDEYWSAEHKKALEMARANEVSLMFLSGNEAFWKIRWEDNFTTMVSYKETQNNGVHPTEPGGFALDPTDTWTELWRDIRSQNLPAEAPYNGAPYNSEFAFMEPENALTGTAFTMNLTVSPLADIYTAAINVPDVTRGFHFWAKSRLVNLVGAQDLNIPVGPEWDHDLDNGFRPAGLLQLSAKQLTSGSDTKAVLQDFSGIAPGTSLGTEGGLPKTLPAYDAGTATHSLTMYRASRKSFVFSAGTGTWSWGLIGRQTKVGSDPNHATNDEAVRQATVNMLADMGALPGSPEPDTADYALITDNSPPISAVGMASNVAGPAGSGYKTWTVKGTASDTGGILAGVEVSYDGGATWHPASFITDPIFKWQYVVNIDETVTPFFISRAVDDSYNMEAVKAIVYSAGDGTKTLYVYGGSADNSIAISKETTGTFTVKNNGLDIPGKTITTGYASTDGYSGPFTNIIVQLAIGQNTITVKDAALFGQSLATVQGAPATVPGFLIIRGGIGKDTINANYIKVGGALAINGKTGADAVTLTTSVVGGTVEVNTRLNSNRGVETAGQGPIGSRITVNDVDAGGTIKVLAGVANDRIDRGTATGDAVTIEGGSGDDIYAYARNSLASDSITDSGGSDWLDFSASPTAVGTSGTPFVIPTPFENIWGTPLADFINGTGGANTIDGIGGNDTLNGGAGNDIIEGGNGDDTIDGGDDTIIGADGDDTYFYSGVNADWGTDIISDGGGTDTLDYSGAFAAQTIDLSPAERNFVENVRGTPFADTIKGNGNVNTFFGGQGNDRYQIDADGTTTIHETLDGDTDTLELLATAAAVKTHLLVNAERLFVGRADGQADLVLSGMTAPWLERRAVSGGGDVFIDQLADNQHKLPWGSTFKNASGKTIFAIPATAPFLGNSLTRLDVIAEGGEAAFNAAQAVNRLTVAAGTVTGPGAVTYKSKVSGTAPNLVFDGLATLLSNVSGPVSVTVGGATITGVASGVFTLVQDLSDATPALRKFGSGTFTIDTVSDRTKPIHFINEQGTTVFGTNVGNPAVANEVNWSVSAHAMAGWDGSSVVEFYRVTENLVSLNIGANASVSVKDHMEESLNLELVLNVSSLNIAPGGKLDMEDNDLILRTNAGNKDMVHAAVNRWIVSAQNGVDSNFITRWDGWGLKSSKARAKNVAQGFDIVGLGAIRNSDLDISTGVPGSSLTTFSSQTVKRDYVLVKFTYTGDGNLNGQVDFDDYAAMDSAFFQLIQNLGWATGDINNDGVITFDDYSIVDQAFFFQLAPL
jgi:hypothetical protein